MSGPVHVNVVCQVGELDPVPTGNWSPVLGHQLVVAMRPVMCEWYGSADEVAGLAGRLQRLAGELRRLDAERASAAPAEVFECERCGSRFGISGGVDPDGEATEYFEAQVAWHQSGECVGEVQSS